MNKPETWIEVEAQIIDFKYANSKEASIYQNVFEKKKRKFNGKHEPKMPVSINSN